MVENKNKICKYVFVNIKEKNLLSFFDDLFKISHIKGSDDFYIYKIVNEKELDLTDIVDSLNVDFSNDIKVFETNYLENEQDVYKLLEIYKKNNKYSYSNISKLVMDLFNNKDSLNLQILKDIVLNKINKDNDLKNIILAMYKHDLNVSKTASSVYMHRNTVINKLDIIKKSSGMDIQKFYDAVAMYALMYSK